MVSGKEKEEYFVSSKNSWEEQCQLLSVFGYLLATYSKVQVTLEDILKVGYDLPSIIDTLPIFDCDVCGKTFTNSATLQVHRKNHPPKTWEIEEEMAFKCKRCGQSFTAFHQLTKHMFEHKDETPYKCNVCEKRFKTDHQLRRHVKVHNTQKSFACEQCNKVFKTNFTLKRHRMSHSRLSFQCKECKKYFSKRVDMKLHIDAVHNTSVEGIKCEVCGKCFKLRYELFAHLAVHNKTIRFECEFCMDIYFSSAEMKIHREAHEEECRSSGDEESNGDMSGIGSESGDDDFQIESGVGVGVVKCKVEEEDFDDVVRDDDIDMHVEVDITGV